MSEEQHGVEPLGGVYPPSFCRWRLLLGVVAVTQVSVFLISFGNLGAFSPGRLTIDYLRGKRASYTPPFRMYLLLSVAFFVVANMGTDPGSVVHLDVDKDGGASFQIGPRDQAGA